MNKFDNEITSSTQAVPHAPKYKLYSVRAVGWGSFLGSCLAGGHFIAMNWLRLGYPKRAVMTYFISVIVLLLSFLLGDLLRDLPSVFIYLPVILSFMAWVKSQQGELLELHLRQNGEMESAWKIFGVAILYLIIIFSLLFMLLAVFPDTFDLSI